MRIGPTKIALSFIATGAMLAAVPLQAAPPTAADAAAVQALVQRTWARFGTTGVPRGARFDPPRTPAFARAATKFLGPDPEGLSEPPDNLYCMCFNEYHPHLARVTVNQVDANTIEAQTVIVSNGSSDTANWRLVRSPNGWLLDDLWTQGGPISVQRRPVRNGRRM